MTNIIKIHYKIFIILLLYITIGIFTISWCPRVFIDEPNISSSVLQQINNIEKSVNMPLAVKNKGNTFLMQSALASPFVKYFHHSPLFIRIPGYACFLLSLIFLYLFFTKKKDKDFAALYCALFGLQFPIFWASHIFRPEIYIILLLTICLYLLTKKSSIKNAFLLGFFSSIGIFAHLTIFWLPPLIAGFYFLPYLQNWKLFKKKWPEMLFFIIGVILSFSLYLIIIDKNILFGMAQFGISQHKPLYKSLFNFSTMIGKYFIADGGWRLFLLLFSSIIISINLKKNTKAVLLEIIPYIYGLTGTFILLVIIGRTSRIYLSFFSIWFLFFLVYSIFQIKNIKIKNLIQAVVLLIYIVYIGLFIYATYKLDLNNYYKELYKMTESIELKTKILGRSQHHYYISEKIDYIYEWDLLAVSNVSDRNLVERYYSENQIDYIIIDYALLNFKKDRINTEKFLKLHSKPVSVITHPYGGTRILDFPIFGGIINFLISSETADKNCFINKTILYKIDHQSFSKRPVL